MAVRRAQRAPQPRRSQHFLRSSALAAELVRLAGVSGDDLVLEVGAGEGVITAELARRAGYVVALEIDHALACRLKERFGPGSAVLVVEGDAYRQSLPRLPFRMVSNVPFDSTTRLLRLLLDDPASRLERAALIVQWGFAVKRTRRRPSTLLGLSWAPWWELSVARRVPAKAFRPAPSVDAGVLVVARRSRPLVPRAETDAFRALLRRSFSAGLRPLLSSRERKRLGIPRGAAPRDLGLEEWLAVYCFLRERGRT